MRGRKPTTPEVRQKRMERPRKGRDVPVLIAGRGIPTMPRGLDPRMQTVWRLVVRDLAAAGVLDRADWAIVEAFAVAVGRARQARALLAGRSLITANSQGAVPHPALAIEERAWKEVRQLAESLPLSPWGRARLNLHGGTGGADGPDDIERNIGPARPLAVVGGRDVDQL